jgi:hypothetical protein
VPNKPTVSLADIDNAPSEVNLPASPASQIDYLAAFTRVSDEKMELSLQCEALKRRDETNTILNSLIKPYALRTFIFMCVYCGYVGIVLLIEMFYKSLPDRVMEILVGSTAVTVIGLVGMVLTGIFVGARGKHH